MTQQTDGRAAALAIVPARAGSKGIENKNLRRVAGRSLLQRTLDCAAASRAVGEVVVTTDGDAIARAAEASGATVVHRPADLATDEASSESALLHVLETLTAERDEDLPPITVFLQCTSPLTRPEDIDGTVGALLSAEADSALAMTRFHGFLWRQGSDGLQPVDHPVDRRERRQEREARFLETGAVYAFRTQGFREARHRFFGRVVGYEMPPGRVLEIDHPDDLRAAERRLGAR